MNTCRNEIVIADFGSQYTLLIAKLIRKLGYYCEIVDPRSIKAQSIKSQKIKLGKYSLHLV